MFHLRPPKQFAIISPPGNNQSAASHSTTLSNRPIRVVTRKDEHGSLWHAVFGKPARQATFYGIPAIAIFVQFGNTMNYDGAARFTADLVRRYLRNGLPIKSFLSVNYPALSASEIKGVRVVPLSQTLPLRFTFKKEETNEKQRVFLPNIEPGSDWGVMEDGYVAITPLQLDQTDHNLLQEIRQWMVGP